MVAYQSPFDSGVNTLIFQKCKTTLLHFVLDKKVYKQRALSLVSQMMTLYAHQINEPLNTPGTKQVSERTPCV